MSGPSELFSVTAKEEKAPPKDDGPKSLSSMPSREANPYARLPGSTGLPSGPGEAPAEAPSADRGSDDDDGVGPAAPAAPKPKEKIVVGDGGAAWRARQLHRMKERAAREGTTLADEAEERYGSISTMRRDVTEKKRQAGGASGGQLSRRPTQFENDGEDGGKPGGYAFDPAKRRREAQEAKAGGVGPRAGGDGHGYAREDDGGGGDVDQGRVDKLLTERVAAKRSREYDKADKIRDELRGMGVEVHDKERTWSVRGRGRRERSRDRDDGRGRDRGRDRLFDHGHNK